MNKIVCCLLVYALLMSGCASGGARSRATNHLLDFTSKETSPNGDQLQVISIAKGLLGTPYHFGGTNPHDGFDCSGYVAYVFKQAVNLSLPRQTNQQIKTGRAVSSSLQPADMVYFRMLEQNSWHTGIYIGKQKFIHAPSSHGVVNIQNMNLPYWNKRFFGARRLLED
jgi:cell wall-associated NlpC family hydrolase